MTDSLPMPDDDRRLRSGLSSTQRDNRRLEDYLRTAGLTPPSFKTGHAAPTDPSRPEMTPPWLATITADVETAPGEADMSERPADAMPQEAVSFSKTDTPETGGATDDNTIQEVDIENNKTGRPETEPVDKDPSGGIYGLRNRLLEAEQLLHELENQPRETG